MILTPLTLAPLEFEPRSVVIQLNFLPREVFVRKLISCKQEAPSAPWGMFANDVPVGAHSLNLLAITNPLLFNLLVKKNLFSLALHFESASVATVIEHCAESFQLVKGLHMIEVLQEKEFLPEPRLLTQVILLVKSVAMTYAARKNPKLL